MNIHRQNAVEWQPPPTNMLKLNTNASFDQNTQLAGFRTVTRDEYWDMILSA